MANRICVNDYDPNRYRVTVTDEAGPVAMYEGAIVEIHTDYNDIKFTVRSYSRQSFTTKPPKDRKVQLLRAMLIARGMSATEIDTILEDA